MSTPTKYQKLTPAVERRVEEICRCMTSRFAAYVRSMPAAVEGEKTILEILHPCNRDEYLKAFGRFLVEEKIEFASND